MKIYTAKTGAYVIFEKANGFYAVCLRSPGGQLIDKIRCDTYRAAMEYKRAFFAIAKNY